METKKDVTIADKIQCLVEHEDEVRAHSIILSMWSTTLRQHFLHETFALKTIKCYGTDINKETYIKFFRCFYYLPDSDPIAGEKIELEELLFIFELSKQFDVRKLESICYRELEKFDFSDIDNDTRCTILNRVCMNIDPDMDLDSPYRSPIDKMWLKFISRLIYYIFYDVSSLNPKIEKQNKDTSERNISRHESGLTFKQVLASNNTRIVRRPILEEGWNTMENKIAKKQRQQLQHTKDDTIKTNVEWFHQENFIAVANSLSPGVLSWLNLLVSMPTHELVDPKWQKINNKTMLVFMIYLRIIYNGAVLYYKQKNESHQYAQALNSIGFPRQKYFMDCITAIPCKENSVIDLEFVLEILKSIRSYYPEYYTTNAEAISLLSEKVIECVSKRNDFSEEQHIMY